MQPENSEMDEPQEVLTGVLLKRAQLALRYRLDESLQGLGLTMPQFVALSALDRKPGATNAELARLSFVTSQTMNSMLALLESAGLVERSGHATHGRLIRLELTDRGREVLVRAEEPVCGSGPTLIPGRQAGAGKG